MLSIASFRAHLNDRIDDQFRVMGFRNPIAPGASVSGFIFVNRDEGIKVVDIDLISYGKTNFFTFFVSIPGIRADYHKVDFEKLYSEEEIVNLDEDDLRTALEKLPCCATNKKGTKNGDPLNLVINRKSRRYFSSIRSQRLAPR